MARIVARGRAGRPQTFDDGVTAGIEDAALGLDPVFVDAMATADDARYAEGYVHGFASSCPEWDRSSRQHPRRSASTISAAARRRR